MPFADEGEALKQAISGFGVDEDSLLEIFSNLKLKDIRRFRTSTPETIKVANVCRYKTIADYDSERMKTCFLHFPKSLEMWTKHPYERDACLIRSAFEGEAVLPKKIVVEVICTRTSAELVGAKMAYQHMYKTTLEQQLETYAPQTWEHKLLAVILAEKTKNVNELEDLQRDVRILFQTLRRGGENRAVDLLTDETIHYINMVLGAQHSKLTNSVSFKEEDVDDYEIIRVLLKCLRDPVSYFRDVIDDAFEANDADALTRVIVTRADIDMYEIKKAFFAKHNISLTQKIKDVAKGYYKDFVLSLLAMSADD